MNRPPLLKMRCKPEKRAIFDIIIEKLSKQFITPKNKHQYDRITNIIYQETTLFFKNHRISHDNLKKLK